MLGEVPRQTFVSTWEKRKCFRLPMSTPDDPSVSGLHVCAPQDDPHICTRASFQRTIDQSNLDDTAGEDYCERLRASWSKPRNKIIQKPQYMTHCWKDVFKEALTKGNLSTLEGICSVYQSLEPTTKMCSECFMLPQKLLQSARR